MKAKSVSPGAVKESFGIDILKQVLTVFDPTICNYFIFCDLLFSINPTQVYVRINANFQKLIFRIRKCTFGF